jgi:hypothetical protein
MELGPEDMVRNRGRVAEAVNLKKVAAVVVKVEVQDPIEAKEAASKSVATAKQNKSCDDLNDTMKHQEKQHPDNFQSV